MSTDLFGVRVLEKEGDSLLLEVFITYSDIELLPQSASFFLMALQDPARPDDPLGAELRVLRTAGQDPYLSDVERFIAEVSVLDQVYPEVTDFSEGETAAARARPERDHRGRKARHRDHAVRSLWFHHHQQERENGMGGWVHEDKLPRGTYFVRVTDPKWIAHVAPGQSWATTAYDG